MQATAFDEEGLFRAIAASSARALLIGRRALVALGIPVLTVDYDFWLHGEDIERLNAAVEPLELFPDRSPAQARGTMKQRIAPAIRELCETPVSLEAYRRRFAVPPSEQDVAETMDLVRWFRRRYPTAKERFAYVRRKYEEWTRWEPIPIDRIR